MKTPRIYIDTSVIGGCYDPEFEPWSNGLLNDVRQGLFIGITSEIVAAEIGKAPLQVRKNYQEFLGHGAVVLPVTEDALTLVEAYQKHGILPGKFMNDMLHIAIAVVADVDILASWNFKHIVRYDKIMSFNAVNLELGYKTLAIHSPREVTRHEKN